MNFDFFLRALPSVLFAALLLAHTTPVSADSTPVRIGAAVSLTGPAAEQGKNWLEGARLALEELKAEGVTAELIIEDDKTSAAGAATAFTKLVTVDRVQAVLGGTWDFLAQATYPLAKKYRVPFLTMTNAIESVQGGTQNNPWVFTSGLSLASTGDGIRKFLAKVKGTRVALLYPAVPFGALHADLFRAVAEERNLTLVVDQEYALESYLENVKVAALKIAREKPDVVFIVTDAGALDAFLAEFSRQKISPLVLTTQHLGAAFALTGNTERFRHAYGVYPEISDSGFETRFRARYGRAPLVYCAEGYDAFKFLANVLMRGIDLTSKTGHYEYKGVTGTFVLPSSSPELVHVGARIMTTRTGSFLPWDGGAVD